jgi:hypothetical protein
VADNLEVKTKLTVETANGDSALKRLQESFEATSSAQTAAQTGMGFFKQSLAMAAGTYIPQAIHQLREFGSSFLEAAGAEAQGQRAMAGMIATMQNVPWVNAAAQSAQLSDQMDAIALKASRMPDDVKDAFQVMLEVGGATSDNIGAATKHVEELSQVSRVLGMSTSALAREFQFMGEGVLRTRGNVFQLLQTTGIFGDKTKGAAAEWAKLTEAQRTERLNKGMELLSSRMAAAPKGMGDLLTEFKAMEEMAKEAIGLPLLNALTPQMHRLVEWMKAGRGSIEEFAKSMVVDVSKYAEEAARVIREGWAYIRENSREIKEDIVAAWGYAKAVIQFAVEHREALAIAYGAKTIAGSGAVQGAVGVGKAVFAAGAAGGITTAGSAGGAALGMGAAGGAAALGAFALAIGSVALAAHQGVKLMSELDAAEGADERARAEFFRSMSDKTKAGYAMMDQATYEHFERTKKQFVTDSNRIGMSRAEASDLADAYIKQYEANRQMVRGAEDAAAAIEANSKMLSGGQDVDQAAQVTRIATGFTNAMNVADTGAQTYIANLLAKSTTLQDAFVTSAELTSAGYEALADATKDSATNFSSLLRDMAGVAAKREKLAANSPRVQFNGGQKFEIKQDFRDQDPDRVVTIFQRDILRSAESRYQSASASPFGA